ncbi:hypothetical protein Tco_1167132 [Tanacetum coccineum]
MEAHCRLPPLGNRPFTLRRLLTNAPRNFVKKFIGTVQFGNDHFGAIMGYGDYVIDLELAFRKHTCFRSMTSIGVDLIKGSRDDFMSPSIPPSVIPTGPSVSISFHHDAPLGSHSPSSSAHQSSSVHHGVATEHSFEVNLFAATEHEPFVNVFAPDLNSEASSSGILMITTPNQSTQPHEHLRKWTDSHPHDNIIGNLICKDISKIIRKPSKTGKHGHEKRKSTREPKIQSQSQRKLTSVNYGSTEVNLLEDKFQMLPK